MESMRVLQDVFSKRGYLLHLFGSAAVIDIIKKKLTNKQLERERFVSVCMSQPVPERSDVGTWSRDQRGCCFLAHAQSASHRQPRPSSLGMMPPTAVWVLPHQPSGIRSGQSTCGCEHTQGVG